MLTGLQSVDRCLEAGWVQQCYRNMDPVLKCYLGWLDVFQNASYIPKCQFDSKVLAGKQNKGKVPKKRLDTKYRDVSWLP